MRDLRIPRIIHQLFVGGKPPKGALDHTWSWTARNPGWEYRFWDDRRSLQFVARSYPQYLQAYRRLIPIQRADFLRYLLLHEYGGLYADVDTTCRRPIEELLRPDDEFVCCLEGVLPDEETRLAAKFARAVQLSSGTFLSVPRHPILARLCSHVHVHHDRRLHTDFVLDTLEKTGNGAFTDAVLAHRSSLGTRILPTYVFVPGSLEFDTLKIDYPDFVDPLTGLEGDRIFVEHHFAGLWKTPRLPFHRKLRRFASCRIGAFFHGLRPHPRDG